MLTKVLPSGVGVITLNNPPVNSLPHAVVAALDVAVRDVRTFISHSASRCCT